MTSLPLTALAVFRKHHHGAVLNALEWFATYMRDASADAQGTYDALQTNPEARARQDETLFTTSAFAWSAGAFAESADKADKAAQAYKALRTRASEDELAEFDLRYGHDLTNALTVQAEHLRKTGDDADTARAQDADRTRAAYEDMTEALEDDEPLDSGFQE